MITPKQDKLHWKRWAACARVNDWRMSGGRLALGARGPETSKAHAQVWDLAERLARQEHRGVTAEDLRHACYVAAAGKLTHKSLNNPEFNRVLTLWKLLEQPMDLDALMEWDHPEIAERRGTIHFIEKHAPDAYVAAISANKFGTKNWRDLTIGQLRQMAMTIRERVRKWEAAGKAVQGGEETEAALVGASSADGDPF